MLEENERRDSKLFETHNHEILKNDNNNHKQQSYNTLQPAILELRCYCCDFAHSKNTHTHTHTNMHTNNQAQKKYTNTQTKKAN